MVVCDLFAATDGSGGTPEYTHEELICVLQDEFMLEVIMLLAQDIEDAMPLLSKPPISRFGRSVSDLVNGPGLSTTDREVVRTIRPEVDRTVTELARALEAEDAKSGRRFAKQARSSLDEILALCEAGGMLR